MKYQDQKIKAIGRLTIITAILTALLIVSPVYPERTRALVQQLPLSRHGNEDNYWIWHGVLATMVPLCWVVDFALIFTSPEQEVRWVKWSKRWLKAPHEFDEIKFDTHDPDYWKVTWRYFLERRKRN